MSIWSRVSETFQNLINRKRVSSIVKELRAVNRQVSFTIALISLGAKMAKADGRVTVDEVRAFRSAFRVDKSSERHVAKVFNQAKQSVAGFEHYASAVAKLYEGDDKTRDDVLEGLFRIAAADGRVSETEEDYLWQVNKIFGFSENRFRWRLERYSIDKPFDPYSILGVSRAASDDEIKRQWKRLVKESHPDIVIARGVPPEVAKLAENRIADYNRAWDEVKSIRRL